jgi:hypothetical protein
MDVQVELVDWVFEVSAYGGAVNVRKKVCFKGGDTDLDSTWRQLPRGILRLHLK